MFTLTNHLNPQNSRLTISLGTLRPEAASPSSCALLRCSALGPAYSGQLTYVPVSWVHSLLPHPRPSSSAGECCVLGGGIFLSRGN